MKYLLDTHILLWWLDEDSPLSDAARQTIDDGHNEISVSAASIWEIGIKKALGKMKAADDLLEILEQNNVTVLSVNARHAYAVHALPRLHGDPFDRMLVVQAQMESLTIMTHDKTIQAYCGSFAPPCLMV